MRYEQFPPHPSLEPWVECYWRLTGGHEAPSGPQRILPDGSTEIILHLGDPFLRLRDAADRGASNADWPSPVVSPTAPAAAAPTEPVTPNGTPNEAPKEGPPESAAASGAVAASGAAAAAAVEVIRDGAEPQAPRLFVGQMTRALRVLPTGQTCVWGIRLHPWAGAAVAGVPAHALTNRITCSDDVCPRLAHALWDALCDAHVRDPRDPHDPREAGEAGEAGADGADDERQAARESEPDGPQAPPAASARRPADLRLPASVDETARCVRALDRVLHQHLRGAAPVDQLVVAASRAILRRSLPIAGMAQRLGVTPRHLERVFQQNVGLTPKMFARISRFQRVAAVLDGGGGSPAVLAAVALDCGYYDQSHLVRDVRAFAGDTPVALRDAIDGELAEYFLRGRRASHFSKIGRETTG